MSARPVSRLGLSVLTVLAVATALYSLRFGAVPFHRWPGVDPGIKGVIERVPVQALVHMIVAPVALLLGPFQFMAGLRRRYPRAHRVSGRLYVAACLLAGLAALATAPFASGGPVAGLGFGVLAVAWIGTTLAAFRSALHRDIARHRRLMRYSYAMTFAAVTLRLQIPLGFGLGFPSYAAMSVWLAYTSWIPNVLAVAVYGVVTGARRGATAGAGAA